jgi:hypothetical protein
MVLFVLLGSDKNSSYNAKIGFGALVVLIQPKGVLERFLGTFELAPVIKAHAFLEFELGGALPGLNPDTARYQNNSN